MSIIEPDRDAWATPPELWAAICAEFGTPLLDVCASAQNAKCGLYYTEEQDGLKQPWLRDGGLNFCNPGYSNVVPWLEKAAQEAQLGACSIVLTHVTLSGGDGRNRTGVKPYFQQACSIHMLLNPRVQFLPPAGVKATSNAKDNMIWGFAPGRKFTETVWWDWTKEAANAK